MHEIYFDNNATTHPLPGVCEAMSAFLQTGSGNPSSAHSKGNRARAYLISARDSLAALLGVDPASLTFTSGATESNNMVLKSAVAGAKGQARIVTTAIEHSSILKVCEFLESRGVEVIQLPVDSQGHIDLDQLRETLTRETTIVSIQWVNNETGVIQPIEAIGEICRSADVPFHTDAAQAVGKVEMNVERLPIDFLSLTGHKFHAPAGIGAVYARVPHSLRPLLHGGDQEQDLRAGTENLVGIDAMGKAAELRQSQLAAIIAKLQSLRDAFEDKLFDATRDLHINGDTDSRVCNTTNVRFSNLDGQALVAQLDGENIFCSQSSACTSQRPEPSQVLRAMGLSEDEAYSSVRFSFSEVNTFDEVDYAVEKIAEICEKLRRFTARLGDHHAQTMETG